MKKLLALILSVVLVLGMFVACGGDNADNGDGATADLKVGFIFLHDENSTYDKNFMDAAKAACEEMNVEYAQKTQIPESKDC